MTGETPLKLCVNGSLGSGKSTVAKALAARLGLEYFGTGRIQRALAEKLGITILELNRRAETDPEIDRLIDAQFDPIAAAHPRIVFDSRLAWHFVPQGRKVRLVCHPDTSARRILGDRDSSRGVEAYDDLSAAKASIAARQGSERKRFLEYYGVDIEDLGNYDLIVQTDLVFPEQVAGAVADWLAAGDLSPSLALNPRMVAPLRAAPEAASEPLRVLASGDGFFAVSGADRLKAAARDGAPWIAAQRLAQEAGPGRSAADGAAELIGELIAERFDPALIAAWEAECGFRFTVAPSATG